MAVGQRDEVLRDGGISMVHLNVASILGAHKFEMLRLEVENSPVEVFSASETWLTADVPDGLVKIEGYNMVRADRLWSEDTTSRVPKKGGGLICYVRKGIKINEFRHAAQNQSCKDLEMQWISLEITSMRRIVLVNIYRPPQGDYKKACKLIHDAITEADLKDNVELFFLISITERHRHLRN